jgi:hypothetical protein
MRYRRALLTGGILLALPFLLAACVTTKSESGSSEYSPNTITQTEIQELGDVVDAYTLIQHYHPRWLEKRGQSSIERPGDVIVYVEHSRQGGPTTLRQVAVANVQKIEYLPPGEATMQYGSGHDNGAIRVHLKDGSSP